MKLNNLNKDGFSISFNIEKENLTKEQIFILKNYKSCDSYNFKDFCLKYCDENNIQDSDKFYSSFRKKIENNCVNWIITEEDDIIKIEINSFDMETYLKIIGVKNEKD